VEHPNENQAAGLTRSLYLELLYEDSPSRGPLIQSSTEC
jgi:hypothetical protein